MCNGLLDTESPAPTLTSDLHFTFDRDGLFNARSVEYVCHRCKPGNNSSLAPNCDIRFDDLGLFAQTHFFFFLAKFAFLHQSNAMVLIESISTVFLFFDRFTCRAVIPSINSVRF